MFHLKKKKEYKEHCFYCEWWRKLVSVRLNPPCFKSVQGTMTSQDDRATLGRNVRKVWERLVTVTQKQGDTVRRWPSCDRNPVEGAERWSLKKAPPPLQTRDPSSRGAGQNNCWQMYHSHWKLEQLFDCRDYLKMEQQHIQSDCNFVFLPSILIIYLFLRNRQIHLYNSVDHKKAWMLWS